MTKPNGAVAYGNYNEAMANGSVVIGKRQKTNKENHLLIGFGKDVIVNKIITPRQSKKMINIFNRNSMLNFLLAQRGLLKKILDTKSGSQRNAFIELEFMRICEEVRKIGKGKFND